MQKFNPKSLKNHYLVIRHGQSEANVSHTIVSSLQYGQKIAGLTELGRKQATETGRKLALALENINPIIISSPFLRTRQTAGIIAKSFGLHYSQTDLRLRERYFGIYEGMPAASNYENAWLADRLEQYYDQSIESPEEISHRLAGLFLDLEKVYQDQTIILVSHGDPIQIMKAMFAQISVYLHHVAPQILPYVHNAEIVNLKDYLKH